MCIQAWQALSWLYVFVCCMWLYPHSQVDNWIKYLWTQGKWLQLCLAFYILGPLDNSHSVKKLLVPYSAVLGVNWLPWPQAGQLFKATGVFYLVLSACEVLSRSSGQPLISIWLSDRCTFLTPLLLLFLLSWQLNRAQSFLFCLSSGRRRQSGPALPP